MRSQKRIRANIDPISNVINPRNVTLRSDLKRYILGPWPHESIQAFIHELTHHWCFHSPVGASIALKQFRALRSTAYDKLNSTQVVDLFDDINTVDCIIRLLRPINEGLALFAEYDIIPGDSKTVSTPLTWATIALSSRSKIIDLNTPEGVDTIIEELNAIRLSKSSLERKMDFLSTPLTEIDEAYFDGYMMIKRLYSSLYPKVSAFRDRDLFLSYVRSFIFDDLGMVNILNKKYEDPNKRVYDAIERFGIRLTQLNNLDSNNRVEEFEKSNNHPIGSGFDFNSFGLMVTNEDIENGTKVLNESISELEHKESHSQTVNEILNIQRGWLGRRSLVYVATEEVLVRVLNGVVTVWPNKNDMEFPLITGKLALSGVQDSECIVEGWLSIILQPIKGFFAPVIGINENIVSILWPPGIEPDADIETMLRDPLNSPPRIEKELEISKMFIDGYIDNAPEEIKLMINQNRNLVKESLLQCANFYLDKWGDSAKLRNKKRLWEFFKSDKNSFETFAALGILSYTDVRLPSIQKILKEQGWDSTQSLMKVLEIESQFNLHFIKKDNGVFRWLI